MNRSHRNVGLLGGALVVAGLLAVAAGTLAGGRPLVAGVPAGPAWMSGWLTAAGAGASPIPTARQGALESAVPAGASVDRATNTVRFATQQVDLTVLAAPPDGPDQTFRVAGLTNPTIVVPRGARVTLRLVNADAGMPHNFLLTSAQPPFPEMGMMMASPVFGAATTTLPEATSDALPSTTVAFTASSAGHYTYLCTVPGHAAEGMYGAFVVTAAS